MTIKERHYLNCRFKFVLCCTILLITSAGTYAQRLGVKAGYIADFSGISYPGINASSNDGFQVGVESDIPFRHAGIGIKTGLLYVNRGFKLTEDYSNGSGVTFYFRTNNVELPVVLYKEFNLLSLKAYAKGGLYTSYILSGKIRDGISSGTLDLNGNARFDYGIVLGLGIKILPNLVFDIDFNHGLKNKKYKFGDNTISEKNSRIAFSMIYYPF